MGAEEVLVEELDEAVINGFDLLGSDWLAVGV